MSSRQGCGSWRTRVSSPGCIPKSGIWEVEQERVRFKVLFLDRRLAATPVMAHLTWLRHGAVVAWPICGKTGGTRALCHSHRSYHARHTLRRQQPAESTADVVVLRVYISAKRSGRHTYKADWMVVVLIRLNWSPQLARPLNRRRFGIESFKYPFISESSYRCPARVGRGTTSFNPAYRFVLIGLTFVFLNAWVHLRWLFVQVPWRGWRWLDTQRF